MRSRILSLLGVTLLLAGGLGTLPAQARGDIDCKMHYTLKGWSIFYQTAKGGGEVTCDNGQSMPVHI